MRTLLVLFAICATATLTAAEEMTVKVYQFYGDKADAGKVHRVRVRANPQQDWKEAPEFDVKTKRKIHSRLVGLKGLEIVVDARRIGPKRLEIKKVISPRRFEGAITFGKDPKKIEIAGREYEVMAVWNDWFETKIFEPGRTVRIRARVYREGKLRILGVSAEAEEAFSFVEVHTKFRLIGLPYLEKKELKRVPKGARIWITSYMDGRPRVRHGKHEQFLSPSQIRLTREPTKAASGFKQRLRRIFGRP